MNPISSLTGAHLRTYRTLLQHPVSHNLGWHDVYALLRHLGELSEEANGNLKATRNGQILVLHPARTKEVGTTEELMALRRFLERSESGVPATADAAPHVLLVIDHHEARIFHLEVDGGRPERLQPPQPSGHFRHAPDAKDFSRGQEKPDSNTFFEPVARALAGAAQILVFGSGTGGGSEMARLIVWLEIHHPATARRIIGTEIVDESHLTDRQLLAKARESYAATGRDSGTNGRSRDEITPPAV